LVCKLNMKYRSIYANGYQEWEQKLVKTDRMSRGAVYFLDIISFDFVDEENRVLLSFYAKLSQRTQRLDTLA
jgi:hypothetical protein